MATDPKAVVPTLQALEKSLKGTSLAGDVTTKLAEMRKSVALKDSIKIAKSVAKTMKRLEKMKKTRKKEFKKANKKIQIEPEQ